MIAKSWERSRSFPDRIQSFQLYRDGCVVVRPRVTENRVAVRNIFTLVV